MSVKKLGSENPYFPVKMERHVSDSWNVNVLLKVVGSATPKTKVRNINIKSSPFLKYTNSFQMTKQSNQIVDK